MKDKNSSIQREQYKKDPIEFIRGMKKAGYSDWLQLDISIGLYSSITICEWFGEKKVSTKVHEGDKIKETLVYLLDQYFDY